MGARPYQQQGLTDIYNEWQTSDILMFVLATGGGKTYTFVEVIKRQLMDGKRVILIAHREELIMQAWQTLYDNKIFAGIIMADIPPKFDLPVQVCSIQTIGRRTNLPPADVLIIDEGHHATKENTYGKLIARYGSAKVLLVTATPYRLSGEGFTYLHPYKKTKLILNRSLKELQDDGWLVPLAYFASSVPDLDNIGLQKGDYVQDEASEAMNLAPLVESYEENAKGKCGVVFTCNVAHSIATVQKYIYAGYPTEHLDANTKDDERKRILSDFRCGLVKIISNVGIITEGFDMPVMEFVQLARPTKSLNLYLQMVGRVTRALKGCVDESMTAADRLLNIFHSTKPKGIILDNAGCWIDNMLPDWPHDWPYYFEGKKNQKKVPDEEIEMLVYVAEDGLGNKIRSKNPKEIEGLKLVEITRENRRKLINFTSIKEFDKLMAKFSNIDHIKKPGYVAIRAFIEYCSKNQILMTDDIWLYLRRKLVDEIEVRMDGVKKNREKNADVYPLHLYVKTLEDIERKGVSKTFLRKTQQDYERDNYDEMQAARYVSKNSTVQGVVI